jgi:hypothetical protein
VGAGGRQSGASPDEGRWGLATRRGGRSTGTVERGGAGDQDSMSEQFWCPRLFMPPPPCGNASSIAAAVAGTSSKSRTDQCILSRRRWGREEEIDLASEVESPNRASEKTGLAKALFPPSRLARLLEREMFE